MFDHNNLCTHKLNKFSFCAKSNAPEHILTINFYSTTHLKQNKIKHIEQHCLNTKPISLKKNLLNIHNCRHVTPLFCYRGLCYAVC